MRDQAPVQTERKKNRLYTREKITNSLPTPWSILLSIIWCWDQMTDQKSWEICMKYTKNQNHEALGSLQMKLFMQTHEVGAEI